MAIRAQNLLMIRTRNMSVKTDTNDKILGPKSKPKNLKSNPLPVVAISFGGMVAQHFALRHPQKVSKLVLCCTSSGGAGGASYPLHELEKLAPAARFAAKMAVSDLRHDAAWQAQQGERLVPAREDAQRQNTRRVSNAALIRGAALQLAARKDHDCHDALPRLTLPTLLCAGRFDGIAPLANMEALAAALPQATLQVFEGGAPFPSPGPDGLAGHSSMAHGCASKRTNA